MIDPKTHAASDILMDSGAAVCHGPNVPSTEAPSITCPRCFRTSYNPNDIREGYCGNCHDWTSKDNVLMLMSEDGTEYEELDLDNHLLLSFVTCPMCGCSIACRWTPEGVIAPKDCSEHQ